MMLKTILCSAALLAASQAQASWFQTYCSTADGTLAQATGHSEWYFNATQRTWDTTGRVDTKLALEGVDTVSSAEQTLVQESGTSCQPGDEYGVGTWRSVTYAKVRVTKTDGSLFPENVVGVTDDRTAIEASWLCETNGNSMMPCSEP